MATSAVGPVMTGGFEEFVINEGGEDYTISFLPDRNNDELQRARQQPVFYYLPEQVRMARKGDRGDYKFRHIHFVGVFDETSVGVESGETQGGVIGFTTTSRFPTAVLKRAEQQILDKFGGRNDKYWGIRTNVAPAIRIAPIVTNVTAVSSVAPLPDGTVAGEVTGGGAAGGGAAGGGASGGGAPGGAPGGGASGGPAPLPPDPGEGGEPRARNAVVRGAPPWAPVPHGRDFRALAIDAWAWKLEGQGPGSITGGENAYAGLIGPIPSEIMWAAFHGSYSPVVVTQNLVIPMWSQLMRVKITGNWSRIFQHFSAHANARYLWFSADIKAEFNNLRINGDIKVELDIDGTMPGGQELEKAINQRIDLIVQQFTEQAKKVIFDPPMPNVQPAQASSGGLFSSIFGGGGGLALRARHDQTSVNLSYEETRYFRYLQPHTISSSLEGFYNELKQDPDSERKYFMRLVLGGLGRKVIRLVKPVVNYPDKAQNWAGQPVAFLSGQVGYPSQEGSIQWKAQTFQRSDPADTTFRPVFVELRKNEVQNPPANWEPDRTFVKRKVHMLEPPGPSEFPFTRVEIERNVIDLDPEPNGSLTNDNILEVRADEMGTLDVGPIALSAVLQSNAEVVEIELRAKGRRADGVDRMTLSTRLRWTSADQDEPRYWRLFTGQADFVPAYQYRVHVTVKGTIFAAGEAWSGPWTDGAGNGALMIDVPPPDGAGVVRRSLTTREMFFEPAVRAAEIPEGVAIGEPAPPPAPVPAPGAGVPTAPGAGVPAAPGAGGAPAAPPVGAPAGASQPGAPGAPRTDVYTGPPPPAVTVRELLGEQAGGTVAGYEVGAPAAQPVAAGAPQRAAAAGGAADAGGWVEMRPGETPAATSSREERKSRSKRGQRQEEDAGEWVEAPPQGRSK